MQKAAEKFKVFELDFGDTNFLSANSQDIIDWIETDMHDLEDDGELSFTIKIKRMTAKEIAKIPEWS